MDLSVFTKAFKEVLGRDLEVPEKYNPYHWETDPAKIEAMLKLLSKMMAYSQKHRNCGKSQFQSIMCEIKEDEFPEHKND